MGSKGFGSRGGIGAQIGYEIMDAVLDMLVHGWRKAEISRLSCVSLDYVYKVDHILGGVYRLIDSEYHLRYLDRDTLLFATGHLRRSRGGPVRETDPVQQLGGTVLGGCPGGAGEVGGDGDVLGGGERVEEGVVLEDEPEGVSPQGRELLLGRGGDVHVDVVAAGTVMEPEVGRSRAPSISSSVVLPDPDGPITSNTSPEATSRSTVRTASTAVSPERRSS